MKILEENELLLKFMFINICSGTAIGMMNLIIPIFAMSMNASSTEIGLIKGVTSIGDLLMVLPAGVLVDYLGSRKMYVISCILGGAMIIIFSLAGSVTDLMVMMVAYGMTRTIRTTSLSASFFKYMNRIGARKGGWYKGSMSIGSTLIGPAIGGVLATLISFTSFFVLTSAFLLAPLTMIVANRFRQNRKPRTLKKSPASIRGSLSYYRDLAGNRELLVASVTDGIGSAFFMSFTTFITVLTVRDLGMSALIAAMLITVRGSSNMFVVFTCGGLLRDDNRKMFLASILSVILGLVALGTARDVPMLAIASTITGAGSGMLTLITFNQVGNISGEKGKIAGLNALISSLGSIGGPILGGIVGDMWGTQAVFLTLVPVYGLLALYALYTYRKVPPPVRPALGGATTGR